MVKTLNARLYANNSDNNNSSNASNSNNIEAYSLNNPSHTSVKCSSLIDSFKEEPIDPIISYTKRKGSIKKGTSKKTNSITCTSSATSPNSTKRKSCNRWTKGENELLIKAIEKYGEKKWNEIAKMVGTKNSDQCNQHWWRVLNPKISKKPWTEEEDVLLVDKVREYGESAWKTIADSLKGRTDIQCRHRWTMLRKYEQEGKGRPISRTNVTCNSNIPIPPKLQETLESNVHENRRATRKRRSVSNVSGSLETIKEDVIQLTTDEDISTPYYMMIQPIVKKEKMESFERDLLVGLDETLVDESMAYDQQEILCCEGYALKPTEFRFELLISDSSTQSYVRPEEQEQFIKQEIDYEERMFDEQNQGLMCSSIKEEPLSQEGDLVSKAFQEWDSVVNEFIPTSEHSSERSSRCSSRQSYLSDSNFDMYM
ncbi:hypothetical protein ABK040_012270 [Willaertia magna]